MLDNNKKLRIPIDELAFIRPEVRQKLFKEIYITYQNKYNIKLLYACLNTNPDVLVDYCIIYKTKNDDGTKDLIIFDVTPVSSDRSTPGYRYCKRNKITDDFYDEGINSMVIMERSKFFEYIEMNLMLSKDKNSEDYWKGPKNSDKLLKGLLDISFRYVKKK